MALKNTAEKQYEKDMKAAGYTDLTGFRLASYASVLVFAKIAERLPNITAPAVFDALSTATDLDVGLTPPLQFVLPQASAPVRGADAAAQTKGRPVRPRPA